MCESQEEEEIRMKSREVKAKEEEKVMFGEENEGEDRVNGKTAEMGRKWGRLKQ